MTTSITTLETIAGRRSIRRYEARPVAPDVVENLLAAAMDAPSAHNRQPWRFVILDSFEAKQGIADAMGRRLEVDRTGDGDDPEAIRADMERSRTRIGSAPLAILVCMTMEDMDRYSDVHRQSAERHMAIQGTAMAVQNLLLAAHAHGLGASWLCAPLFCPDTVAAALALPEAWEPQALVTAGYPANAGKPYRRRPRADVVRYVKRLP
jgi:F420 biosynthesis protein FbiB-like protein